MGDPHFDLSPFFGDAVDHPMYVAVENLLDVVKNHDDPEIGLHWDGDKILSLKAGDGGVMASFQIEF